MVEGELPAALGMLEYLKELNLNSNQFSGSIPESLGQLSQLVHLDLTLNSWEGILTESHFRTLTKLKSFAVSTYGPRSLIFNMAHDWVPPFQLNSIDIADCRVGPAFGVWLQSQTELTEVTLRNTSISDFIPEEWFLKISFQLRYLDLSNNQIRGKLPFHMNSPSLGNIYLSHNQFVGPLPHWSSDAATTLDLRSNSFSGPIPSNYDQLLPNLIILALSDNHLNGSIPPSVCTNLSGLSTLILRSNHLSGELPRPWSLWRDLWVVDVADNNLSGNFSSSMGVPSSLNVLDLSNNNFGGQIPSSLFQNCSKLVSIDLGGNRFTGSIPLQTRPKVSNEFYMLRLRSNSLSGHIPHQLCSLPSIHIIDLGHNKFSGTIPKCLYNLTALAYVNDTTSTYNSLVYSEITSLTLKGQELVYNTNLYLVKSIDFSSNNLEGVIPEEISSLIALGTLNLSRNQLSGNIPSKIGNLQQLETLDLSHNHLSGQIPHSLSLLNFLAHLNLSFNNLSGRIPSGNQLQTLNDSSIYEGNPSLCGVPLSTVCPGDGAADPGDGDHNDDDIDENGKFGIVVSAVLGFIIGFWSVCGTLFMKKSWRYAYFRFFDDIKEKAALAIALRVARWQRRT
ncbi:putative leucine-rich repeat domain, L domain-containing protein [Rosa chinensis]|uniref:Putative leucine-rich repeat domain, L domain-containing protein n=1 Tax=Rosa chinensis TaxID=74649 RepID=A0A2P6Q7U7_ROSCH|nr:putative leucine-rich repeat domain, L domain-containing protein [Rosa chinensis]